MGLKLVIDADPGIGDALAIALALLDPDVELLAVTAVAGRTSGEQAERNILALLTLLDSPRLPRVGACEGLEFRWPAGDREPDPAALHGPWRLGDLQPAEGGLHQKHDAAKLLVDIVRFHPNEVVVLSLGPLTNLVRASEHWPEFWSSLRGIVSLAGALQEGDVSAIAEFNVFADPESARVFLNAPATRTLVPLETGRKLMLTFEQYDRLNRDKYSRVGQFLERTIAYALRSHRQHLGKEALWLPEVVALAAAVHPRLFEHETMAVDVELDGSLTRGMTVIDRRSTSAWRRNVGVATDVDAQGVLDYLCRVLNPG